MEQIYVRTVNNNKLIVLDIDYLSTIADVKEMVMTIEQIPPKDQQLIFSGKELSEDGKTLFDCAIQRSSTLQLLRKSETAHQSSHG